MNDNNKNQTVIMVVKAIGSFLLVIGLIALLQPEAIQTHLLNDMDASLIKTIGAALIVIGLMDMTVMPHFLKTHNKNRRQTHDKSH